LAFAGLALVCLAFPLLSLAEDAPQGNPRDDRGPQGERVRSYTKIWTDDYSNDHRDVYRAYTKSIRDQQGQEYQVEIWHGLATGYHNNGQKSWECRYVNGQRDGEFRAWADNGQLTMQATVVMGRVHGLSTEWSGNHGRKMRELTYEQGQLQGRSRTWDMEGELLTDGLFRAGQPWEGSFPLLDAASQGRWVIRHFEAGKQVREENLTRRWWW